MIQPFVVDSSVAISWVVEAQATNGTNRLRSVAALGVVVPPLWAFEVANTLLVLKRRRKITENEFARYRRWMNRLNPELDTNKVEVVFDRISDLAVTHNLTVSPTSNSPFAADSHLHHALNQAARLTGVETLL